MQIDHAVALVTGANRGLGAHFVRQLIERGAKVYAAARDGSTVTEPGALPLDLDVTNQASIAAAAQAAADTTLLVNNAGVALAQNLVAGDLDQIRREMETNTFGALSMIRAFAPHLAANGGGAIVNVLSAASWLAYPGHTSYAMSKAAAWSMTNGVRTELAQQGTQVTGVHVGMVDTDMSASVAMKKMDPADVVRITLDHLEGGAVEVIVDDMAKQAKESVGHPPAVAP